jgi:hypothetical protein
MDTCVMHCFNCYSDNLTTLHPLQHFEWYATSDELQQEVGNYIRTLR